MMIRILQTQAQQLRLLATTLVLAAGVAMLTPERAAAQDELGGTAAQRAGSLLVGAGLGPAFSLDGGGSGFHLQFNGSYAVKERLWAVFTPSFVFMGGGALVTLPVGVQYDVPIASVPNLYVYPRLSIGLGIFTGGGSAMFALIPEAGVKYVIEGKYFIGLEPFSLPIYIGDGTATFYRLNFLAGLYL